ncbi:restriction endonuclease [Hymenobacter negativus]|uniref:Restriction endonuclease n=1 Tax=Hymenobacter negativus TaxID=2795026 RepID=A0ABS0QDK8_9BACT|nr:MULTISPECIES: restriction endonuclease [Bacteria]MBH8560532.1 restriction endonuclease [Hymenobacter negativus]MBH8569828.1 restriction endonuclease [Hymenobacter negativus]MBR7209567.1 restriction endonuclease [Microvirga sp. STS02]
MGIQKSPIDELFFELYGYYPNKAGQAYEMLVAAAFKIVTGQKIKYDQHLRGTYSKTDYQIDGLNEDESLAIEAKDYTIDERKVGRPDIQKLQGALSDLNVSGGLFASATDYTRPAEKYADSSNQNPLQKEIELYHIRPSTELDEQGRIKTFIVNINMIVPNFSNGQFNFAWTTSAVQKFEANGLTGKPLKVMLDRFYNEDGSIDCFLMDFTHDNQPLHVNMEDKFADGCWVLPNRYIMHDNELYEIKGIEYKIPYNTTTSTLTIDSEGVPKILIKSEGKIDKLLTDKQFKDLSINNGEIN